jgi:sorting nexin-3/12
MVLPSLPDKAWQRQLPFRSIISKDNGLFDEAFIEERRKGLEEFINKFVS